MPSLKTPLTSAGAALLPLTVKNSVRPAALIRKLHGVGVLDPGVRPGPVVTMHRRLLFGSIVITTAAVGPLDSCTGSKVVAVVVSGTPGLVPSAWTELARTTNGKACGEPGTRLIPLMVLEFGMASIVLEAED